MLTKITDLTTRNHYLNKMSFLIKTFILLFIYFNIIIRFYSVYNTNYFINIVLIVLSMCCLIICILPRLLKNLLFIFGLSFFLFGFRPYDIETQVFELIVTLMASTLLAVNLTSKSKPQINIYLLILTCCYICLSMFSILLFPIAEIMKNVYYFGITDFFNIVFNVVPSSSIYIFAGLNRLILFFVFAFLLSISTDHKQYFNSLFSGIFLGAILASIIGILDLYQIIDLSWYRPKSDWYVLKSTLLSTFLNRGWFSEFIVIVIPFCLIAFIYKGGSIIWNIILFASLIICEIALLLSGARAGWVSYPLVLLICWSFVHIYKNKNFNFKRIRVSDYIKVLVSMPITIILSILILYQVLIPLTEITTKKNRSIKIQSNIKKQTSRLFNPEGRFEVWKHGLAVGIEKPVFGMGYDAFSWHGNILTKINDSYYNKYTNGRVQDTPHNIFIHLFDSGGIVGLILWFCMMGCALMMLTVDFVKNKKVFNAAVIVSILSFHFIGIFQSMQYIPMIWLLVFINYGYAMTIDKKILSRNNRKAWNAISVICVVIVCFSSLVYYQTAFSQTLKYKYGLKKYAPVNDHGEYYGFYGLEKWADGNYRWTGKHAAVKLKAESDILGIKLIAHPHNSSKPDGLEVKLFLDGDPLDIMHFVNGGEKNLFYHCPKINNKKIKVEFKVNKTFNPRKMGLSNDSRNLGVAVKDIQFLNTMQKKL